MAEPGICTARAPSSPVSVPYITETSSRPGIPTARSASPSRSKSPLARPAPNRSWAVGVPGTPALAARDDGRFAGGWSLVHDHDPGRDLGVTLRRLRHAEDELLATVAVEVERGGRAGGPRRRLVRAEQEEPEHAGRCGDGDRRRDPAARDPARHLERRRLALPAVDQRRPLGRGVGGRGLLVPGDVGDRRLRLPGRRDGAGAPPVRPEPVDGELLERLPGVRRRRGACQRVPWPAASRPIRALRRGVRRDLGEWRRRGVDVLVEHRHRRRALERRPAGEQLVAR